MQRTVILLASIAAALVWSGSALTQGRSEDAHHHVVICHRTGSESNPYVVINVPWTAWTEAHSPGASPAHPTLNGRDDIMLEDPASAPGTKDGFTADDCVTVSSTTGGTTTGTTGTTGTTTGTTGTTTTTGTTGGTQTGGTATTGATQAEAGQAQADANPADQGK
jgi:hypothetical protein